MSDELPQGWASASFMDVFDIQGGTQPPKSTFKFEPTDGYVRLLQIRDFGEKPVPTFIQKKPTLKTCQKDDVLIGRYGASVGRICTGMEGAYNVALAKVILPQQFERRFVFHLLRSPFFQRPILDIERSAQDGFNKEDLAEISLPIAPLAEQRRIVTKLEMLLSKVDTCQQRLAKIPVLLKRFRQSVLAAACSGRLTADWREENPAPDLDNEAAQEAGLPPEWSLKLAPEVCSKVTDGEHIIPKRLPAGKPFLSAKNVRDGFIDYSTQEYISPEDFEKSVKRCGAERGDTLLVSVGATIGRAAIVVEPPRFALARSVALLKPRLLIGKFQLFAIQSRFMQDQIRELQSGTAQPCLFLKQIAQFRFPVPPLAEQQEIVRRVEGLFALADQIEARFHAAQTQVAKLTPSLLARAFRGHLVPQDPTDEPAETLLSRIRTPSTNTNKTNENKSAKQKG